MSEETKKALLDATAGIRDEYLEEAACEKPVRRPWLRVAAMAAVLALVIGSLLPLRQDAEPGDMALPFFAVYAYAQDGSPVTLNGAGDICNLRTGTSEAFPSKETFTLDILLMDADGTQLALQDSDFSCIHRYGTNLKPGESDDSISISWLEEDGLFGYRITGWCEELISLDILIKWKDGLILHQSSIIIQKDEEYRGKVYTFYNYERDLSTEALIDKILDENQNYSYHAKYSSSFSASYSTYLGFCGGFAELERREDAPSLLAQRWIKERQNNEHKSSRLEACGLTGLLLSQDVYWDRLTQKEKKLIEKYLYDPDYQNDEPLNLFPSKMTFSYELIVEDNSEHGPILSFGYEEQWLYEHGKHVGIAAIHEETVDGTIVYRYLIAGWFDEPTELTLTAKDRQDGTILQRVRLLITPTEDGYEIRVLTE